MDNCSIEYNGIVYKNKLDCCEALDLNYTDVTLLCNKYNYIFSVAVYTLLTLGARYTKYSGSFYKTRDEVYNTFGLCYATVINIMRRIGCKWESAVDYALIRKNYYLRGFVYSENGLGSSCFKCKCKNCGLSFLFTADLAFGHIQNCYNESVGV